MLTQSTAGQSAGLSSADLELVNYGRGHAWLRRELDAPIADADRVHQELTRTLRDGPRYWLTELGRRALDEDARARAMEALFGRLWPKLSEVPA